MIQKERIINYIKTYGSITPLDAFRDLGITKLATVISLMKREDNIIFYQHYEGAYNRFGERVYYMRYWLDKDIYQRDMNEEELFYKEVE